MTNTKNFTEDFFSWYVIYDMPFQNLSFDFEKNSATLHLLDFNPSGDYTPIQLIFRQVGKFTLRYPEESFVFQPISIVRAECKKINEYYFELYLHIDMPKKECQFGNQEITVAGEMCIGFEDLDVIGGLTREQMLQKWADEN